jgi:hypothetical protein
VVRSLLALLLGLCGIGHALAQSNPGFQNGNSLPAASLNAAFVTKLDANGGIGSNDTLNTSTLNSAIQTVWLSGSSSFKFGPCEISYGTVTLPSGLTLRYADPGVRMGDDGHNEYVYRYGKFWHKLYGAKFLENIVQALARIVVMNAALRIRDRGLCTANPADYPEGVYQGFSIVYTPARGFTSIVINLIVTNFVAQ